MGDLMLAAYGRPWLVLCATVAVMLAAGWFALQVRLDASTETLAAEQQADVGAYQAFAEDFAVAPFLLVTYAPEPVAPVVERSALDRLHAMQSDLNAVPGVSGTLSILDVPLLQAGAPPERASDGPPALTESPRTLRDDGVDLERAARELTRSPLFADNLISSDGTAAAIRVMLSTPGSDFRPLVAAVRAVADNYRQHTLIHIGGIPLIAADMIDFVRSDLIRFGAAVIALMAVMMFIFFRHWGWVTIALLTGVLSVLLTLGWLGWIERPITVVSANFVPIVFILGVSLAVHLIVRFRELAENASDPTPQHRQLVLATMTSKFAPSAYTALTTVVAFGSLTTSEIQPIVDFGWMVCLGVTLALAVAYSLIPALLLVWSPPTNTAAVKQPRVMKQLEQWSTGNSHAVLAVATIVAVVATIGLPRVQLDSRFVDYFADDTAINRGLTYVDGRFGGALPFEVIVEVPPYEPSLRDDPFINAQPRSRPETYWFTRDKLDLVAELDAFIAQQPHVGQTISLHSLEQVAMKFTGGERLDPLQIPAVLNSLSTEQWHHFIRPYANPDAGLLRIGGRMQQSSSFASHRQFEQALHARAATLELQNRVTLTGMMVLFDNMLERLLGSQTNSLLVVLGLTLLMFLLLLRSPAVALVGLIPNVMAAGLVIATMGFLGAPLDIMTITVAAICIGMGVDDAIHYLHRFQHEWRKRHNVPKAVHAAHASVGRAMYFTSATVVVGFSVMALSNFVPTVRFGLLTALAMVVVLLANLLVVPGLLMIVHRWFGWRPLADK